jgi:hypothetical protein
LAVRWDDPEGQDRKTAFVQALQQLGWTDGRNVRIDTRWGSSSTPSRASSTQALTR